MIQDICQICGGVRFQHFSWCDRESRMSAEEARQAFEPPLAVALSLVFEQVRCGARFSIVGSGPLSSEAGPPFAATLTSHSGARGASATGHTLAECLDLLLRNWGKL